MSDGRIHGVHVWIGPTDAEPPERPIPGPLKWDLTAGDGHRHGRVADQRRDGPAARNAPTAGRSPRTCPAASLNRDEAKVLSLAIDAAPDRTYCTTWDFTDKQGSFRRVGFVARTAMETARGRHRPPDRPGDEPGEASSTRPPLAHRPPGPADPQRAVPARGAPGARRPEHLDSAEVARRPVPVLRLARTSVAVPPRRPVAARADDRGIRRPAPTSRVLRLPGDRRRLGADARHGQPGGARRRHLRRSDQRCDCRPTPNSPTRPGRVGATSYLSHRPGPRPQAARARRSGPPAATATAITDVELPRPRSRCSVAPHGVG